MKVKFLNEDGKQMEGEVIATIGDWYRALFVILLKDNTFVKVPIESCTKL